LTFRSSRTARITGGDASFRLAHLPVRNCVALGAAVNSASRRCTASWAKAGVANSSPASAA
jgi:hypothetical protein